MIYVLMIIGYLIISITIFYPRDLVRIIGEGPNIGSSAHLTVIHRNSISEEGTIVESYNKDHSKEILEFLRMYKYRKTNISYQKLDNVEYYTIKIENDGQQVFRAAVRGDRYLSVIDRNGNWSIFRVSGDKFDTKFLEDLYKNLSKID